MHGRLHLYAGMTGPVLFGFAIDYSCLLWEKKCDGSTGSCLYYDNHEMAWLLFAVCAACKVFTIISGLFTWRLYMRRLSKGDAPQTTLEDTPTAAAETENGQTGSKDGSTEDVVDKDRSDGISNPALEVETSNL